MGILTHAHVEKLKSPANAHADHQPKCWLRKEKDQLNEHHLYRAIKLMRRSLDNT